jgi:hypothetical protein
MEGRVKSAWLAAAVGVIVGCRSAQPAAPAPAATPPARETTPPPPPATPVPSPLAASVPAQPPPPASAPADRPYREILDLKKSGASDDVLLQKVLASRKRYDLTTEEVLELRRAGVPERVVEAMLRSGI